MINGTVDQRAICHWIPEGEREIDEAAEWLDELPSSIMSKSNPCEGTPDEIIIDIQHFQIVRSHNNTLYVVAVVNTKYQFEWEKDNND